MFSKQQLSTDLAGEISTLRKELDMRRVPENVETIFSRLKPLSIGPTQQILILFTGTRMFRIRKMGNKPNNISEIDAPPAGIASIQRLNETGQSILYLADSPGSPRQSDAECAMAEFVHGRPHIVRLSPGRR